MKKCLALLLALCLLLGTGSAFATVVTATVGTSSTTSVGAEGEQPAVVSMAAVGGTPCLLHADGRLTSVNTQTREETLLGNVLYSGGYMDDAALADALTGDKAALTPVELLLVADGRLMGLCLANGALYTLLDDTGAFAPAAAAATMDVSALRSADGAARLSVLDACVQDGKLYLLTRDDTSGQPATTVRSLDLATGTAKAYAVQNLQDIEAYQGGTLLARRFDMNALYTASAQGSIPASEYGTFDPAADAFSPLGTFATDSLLGGYAISGTAYSAQNDTLYYISGSRVEGLTLATGEKRVSAYTSEGMFGNMGGTVNTAFVEGGFYLRGDQNGYQLFALDTDAVKNGALRIFGEFGSDAHKSFAKNYPDIPVEVAEDFTTDLESLANAMVSETGAYDVLNLMLSYMPVERLIAKGYCTDLSGYPEIMERVAKLDPRFVASMTVDGKLYGVPVASTGFSYAVDMEQWQALGLTEDDLPQNLVELYDFIANYMADYGEDNPDIRLFDMGGDQLKTILFSLMLDNYITYCQSQLGGETAFDSDMPRQLLTAFEQIDFAPLKDNTDQTVAANQQKPFLFSVYMPLTTFSSAYDKLTPLVLPLTADVKPVLGANLSVLVINPKSKRMGDAVKYLCNYLDNLDDGTAIVLNPSDNEPRIAKDYEKNLKAIDDELAKQQALLTAADADKQAGIQATIDQLTSQREQVEANKYSVSAEQIARFREQISDKLVVCQQSVLYSADKGAQNELSKLIMQYLDGGVSMDQFLKEMDKRARMMTLENQ